MKTSSNLQWPLKGNQVSDLANIMKAGQAYADIRTKQNPKGEIRGQIIDSDLWIFGEIKTARIYPC